MLTRFCYKDEKPFKNKKQGYKTPKIKSIAKKLSQKLTLIYLNIFTYKNKKLL